MILYFINNLKIILYFYHIHYFILNKNAQIIFILLSKPHYQPFYENYSSMFDLIIFHIIYY